MPRAEVAPMPGGRAPALVEETSGLHFCPGGDPGRGRPLPYRRPPVAPQCGSGKLRCLPFATFGRHVRPSVPSKSTPRRDSVYALLMCTHLNRAVYMLLLLLLIRAGFHAGAGAAAALIHGRTGNENCLWNAKGSIDLN